MRRLLWIAGMAMLLVLCVQPALANGIPVGVLSYDQYFNVATGTTVGAFDINNLVGDPALGGSALPPAFNVFSFLNINNATLTLNGPSAPSSPISLGTIGPGFLSDASGNPLAILQFALSSSFTSVLLQGNLSTTTLTLSNGTTISVLPNISILLTPSSGSNLVAGSDFMVINANTAVTAVPEPATFGLILAGMCALVFAKIFVFRGVFFAGR